MNDLRTWLLLPLWLLGMAPAFGETPTPEPRVLVSIKPIHALVAGVMRDVAYPDLLIRGTTSPHAYALRPSDARKLHRAHLFFWIGPELETVLTRVIDTLPDSVEHVALLSSPSLHRLPNRMDGPHAHGTQAHGTQAHDIRAHDQTASTAPSDTPHGNHPTHWDPHIWLNPDNATIVVTLIEQRLSARFPHYAPIFQANAANLRQRLHQLDHTLKQRLIPVQRIPFVVYHDAYHYFEQHYRLHTVSAVTLHPGRPSSAKRIRALRTVLKTAKPVCLFIEPQFRTATVQSLIENFPITVATLDPLGANLDEGETHYVQLLRTLTDNLIACLQSSP